MSLQAPVIEVIPGGVVASSSSAKGKNVRFLFEKQVFWANKVKLYQNKIYLQNGFQGSSKDAVLQGRKLVYNLSNNFFDAEDVEVSSGFLDVKTRRLFFYGRSIVFDQAHLGLTFLDLGISFDTVTTYPGWMVIKDLSIGYGETPFYTIPVWVYDLRRNAFSIPYPLPEAGATFYRGNYLLLNWHYYLNEYLYGFTRFGSAQKKGYMVGCGQILRLDDQQQVYLGADLWTLRESQVRMEYNFSFMGMPYKKRALTFGELVEYNRKVSQMDSSDLRATYTKREEINDEEVDRDMEFAYNGHFTLLPKLGLDLELASGRIYEHSTTILATRTNSDMNFGYEYPLGFLEPLWWGLGYFRSDYDVRPWSWQRVEGSVEWGKHFWLFGLGFKYSHYFYDFGASPFLFDQKYVLPDNNILYDLRLGWKDYHIGVKYWVDIKQDLLVDTTSYLACKIAGWMWHMSYSTLRKTFSLNAEVQLF